MIWLVIFDILLFTFLVLYQKLQVPFEILSFSFVKLAVPLFSNRNYAHTLLHKILETFSVLLQLAFQNILNFFYLSL